MTLNHRDIEMCVNKVADTEGQRFVQNQLFALHQGNPDQVCSSATEKWQRSKPQKEKERERESEVSKRSICRTQSGGVSLFISTFPAPKYTQINLESR